MLRNLNDDSLSQMKVKGFTFSTTKLEHLLSDAYTLVNLVVDVSGSVYNFKDDLEKCLQKIIEACRKSPRADNLLIRLLEFNNNVNEIHGYKLLQNCNVDDYIGILNPTGLTALFDATQNAIETCKIYAEDLIHNSYSVNAIIYIITDGLNNNSTYTEATIKEIINKIRQEENLESITLVLVGVNTDELIGNKTIKEYLEEFKNDANLDAYVNINEATPQKLAKLADFVSKSIVSSSTSLGSGNAPQIQSLTI